jgi:hypothetical protein
VLNKDIPGTPLRKGDVVGLVEVDVLEYNRIVFSNTNVITGKKDYAYAVPLKSPVLNAEESADIIDVYEGTEGFWI